MKNPVSSETGSNIKTAKMAQSVGDRLNLCYLNTSGIPVQLFCLGKIILTYMSI